MNATMKIGVASVLALMALAGCTGSFDVDQTEPFRVQLDGAPQTVVVREGAEPREVNVQTCPDTADPCDVEEIDVEVKVEKTSSEACKIRVVIKTVSGEILDEKTIDVGGDDDSDDETTTSDDNGTDDNGTTTVTETETTTESSSSNVVIQNLVVNVKGNKNVIVVTQAVQGEANVGIQAIKASGHSDVDADPDVGSSGSETMTPASSTTTTY